MSKYNIWADSMQPKDGHPALNAEPSTPDDYEQLARAMVVLKKFGYMALKIQEWDELPVRQSFERAHVIELHLDGQVLTSRTTLSTSAYDYYRDDVKFMSFLKRDRWIQMAILLGKHLGMCED